MYLYKLSAFAVVLVACTGPKGDDIEAPAPIDADEDGFVEAEDCDDANAAISPGAAEAPYDGIDNDCDALTPDDDIDADDLLFVDDCNDTDPLQGGPEVPSDRVDNDCDLAVDCDDTDLVHGDWVGDVTLADLPDFCTGYDCRSITGTLILDNSTLTDLSDLTCVSSVGGDISLGDSDELLSLSGLDALTSVGGALYIVGNQVLTSLSGLESLVSVGRLDVTLNLALTSLSGLQSLTTVNGDIGIFYNPELCADEVDALLAQLTVFTGDLDSSDNTGVCP